ncbi:MAG TPA: NADH-quinone oxidoreductase subunit A [Acidimicrobiales bacterium]|nr:NADH-quinone oxidoreductase subunit A [Acidimicrobiales bacterium]
MGQYLPLVVLMVLAAVFVAGSLVTSRLLAPNRKTPAKLAPYESGIIPTREPPERFPVKFFLVAMSFIVFDIEIIFLFPWATIYRQLGAHGLFAILLFSLPIVISLAYEFSRGALDWGPLQRRVRADVAGGETMVSEERTLSSTVRRVGLDGRTAGTDEAA